MLSAVQAIGLGGEDKITLGQSTRVVVEDGEFDFSPDEEDVGMVAHGLGDFADFVGKLEGLEKVFEFVFLFQMMGAHDFPAFQLFGTFRQFFAFEALDRRLRNTLFIG